MAARGPERTGYGYGYEDAVIDGATTEKGPPIDAHASAVRAAKVRASTKLVVMMDDAVAGRCQGGGSEQGSGRGRSLRVPRREGERGRWSK